MLAAHDVGVENMKEGAVAEEVDKKSLDQIRKAGFEKFLRHRTGHGIGLEGHEAAVDCRGRQDRAAARE